MSCFSSTTNTTTTTAPDLAKHVNYNIGMVLGVDDFTQEFAYLSGRDQWLARDLIGYGTVRGLKVSTGLDAEKGPRVMVDPGVAVSPSGQMICVPAAQCAYLKNWVTDHAAEVTTALGSAPASSLMMTVVLCYRDCPVDNVPIAGEPCRSEDQLMAPSRVKDDFCLELRVQPANQPLSSPPNFYSPQSFQREEDAIRDFVEWIAKIPLKGADPSTPMDQFLKAIREAAKGWFTSPPPSSPPGDYMWGEPPAFMKINPADVCKYRAAAFRVWVTELRPKWISRWHGCAPSHFGSDNPHNEDCVVLAELNVPVTPKPGGGFDVTSTDILVNEDRRPYLVHLRLLQEWLFCEHQAVQAVADLVAQPRLKITNLDGPAALDLTNEQCLVCNTAGGAIKLALPPAVNNDGRLLIVKRTMTGAAQVGIAPALGETIDGGPNAALSTQGKYLQLVADAKLKSWLIVANN